MAVRIVWAVEVEDDQSLPALAETYDVQNDTYTWLDAKCVAIEHISEEEGAAAPAWIVGLTDPPTRLRRFASEDEAVAFVSTLEGVEDGVYYIDPPDTGEQ